MAVSDVVAFTLDRLAAHDEAERNGQDEALTDDSIVEFEGQPCRWGDLTVQDRKAYFTDGYPF